MTSLDRLSNILKIINKAEMIYSNREAVRRVLHNKHFSNEDIEEVYTLIDFIYKEYFCNKLRISNCTGKSLAYKKYNNIKHLLDENFRAPSKTRVGIEVNLNAIITFALEKETLTEVAKATNLSRQYIYKILKKHRLRVINTIKEKGDSISTKCALYKHYISNPQIYNIKDNPITVIEEMLDRKISQK